MWKYQFSSRVHDDNGPRRAGDEEKAIPSYEHENVLNTLEFTLFLNSTKNTTRRCGFQIPDGNENENENSYDLSWQFKIFVWVSSWKIGLFCCCIWDDLKLFFYMIFTCWIGWAVVYGCKLLGVPYRVPSSYLNGYPFNYFTWAHPE